jgi:hypothetical protein
MTDELGKIKDINSQAKKRLKQIMTDLKVLLHNGQLSLLLFQLTVEKHSIFLSRFTYFS